MLAPAGTPITLRDVLTAEYHLLFDRQTSLRLDEQLAAWSGSRFRFTLNSGRAALYLVLAAVAKLTGKSEIIVPGYTCFSVPSAIRQAGLRARLVDVSPNSLSFDPQQLSSALNDTTAAILLIYPFALAIDPAPVLQLARQKSVLVIEDAAQSMGLSFDGKLAGTIGDAGLYSLSKGKMITSIRGGVIVTNHLELGNLFGRMHEQLPGSSLKQDFRIRAEMEAIFWGLRPSLFGLIASLPFVTLGETRYEPGFSVGRMPKMSQALLLPMLAKLRTIAEARFQTAGWYIEALGDLWPRLRLQGYNHASSKYLRLPLLLPDAELAQQAYEQLRQLGASRMYHRPLAVIDDAGLYPEGDKGSTPGAADIAARLVTLPTHAFVNQSHARQAAAQLKQLLG